MNTQAVRLMGGAGRGGYRHVIRISNLVFITVL